MLTTDDPREPFIEAERRKMLEAKTIKDAKRIETMTRDEHRAKCFEAMAAAMFDCYRGYNDETQKMMWIMAKGDLEFKAERAFDSLYGLVLLISANRQETIEKIARLIASRKYGVPDNGEKLQPEIWQRELNTAASVFGLLSAGDLTKPPEHKP